jgi:hypothetical protein
MKRKALYFAIIMGISALAFADPKIMVLEKSWDFGHIPQNATFSHDYWIKNVGTDTLKIVNVKPG